MALANGQIKYSESKVSTPILFIPKKNRELRLYIDYLLRSYKVVLRKYFFKEQVVVGIQVR